MYVGNEEGIFKSTDGGKQWEKASAGLEGVAIVTLTIHPKDPNTLFAATADGVMFKSDNAGQHWQRQN